MKLRDLRIAKRYRDTVKKWGEPNLLRKRIMIAPLMSQATAKEVNIRPAKEGQSNGEQGNGHRSKNLAEKINSLFEELKIEKTEIGNDAAEFSREYDDYLIWIEKEKKLRKDLKSIGLNQNWLMGKNERTAIEARVLERLQPKDDNGNDDDEEVQEIEPHVIPTPPPLTKAQMKLLPLLQQPIPVALSIIAEYCHQHKLRLLDLYTQMDKDKDWLITREEVRKIVKDNEIPLAEAQLEDMIIALDVDNNDQLDYRELAQGVEAYKIDERWQKIREVMKIMEAHQESTKERQRKTSSSTVRRSAQMRGKKIGSARHGLRKYDGYTSDDTDSSIDRYLQLPIIDINDDTDSLASKSRERRLRKHRERKEKTKQRQKQTKSKGFQPSTIEGTTGQMKDRYADKTVTQVNQSLDLMHTNGIPVKEDAVKKVMLFPFDKPIDDCKAALRQSGTGLMSNSQFGNQFADSYNTDPRDEIGKRRKDESENGRSRVKNKRRSHKEKSRMRSPFWTDMTYSQLSMEQLGRRTPQEGIFNVIKT